MVLREAVFGQLCTVDDCIFTTWQPHPENVRDVRVRPHERNSPIPRHSPVLPSPPVKLPRLRTVLLAPLVLLALAWVALSIYVATMGAAVPEPVAARAPLATIAILGASGTAGDGILEAALADPDVGTIRVITRRITPRMEEGIAAGRIEATIHRDYVDYADVREQLAGVDAVFWAIGLSSIGVDEDTYREIHVAFPRAFIKEWLSIADTSAASFHYISSSDISADSRQMWARVKVEAENTLFDLARGTRLRVIAYRPDYIRPTAAERHVGQNVLYWFFAPLGVAVEARQIGEAMLEVAARGDEFENGDKLGTRRIIGYSEAYGLSRAGF
ncbi:MAG TPA: hypothetical protein VFZ51_06585 [Woeseiaceae bacterium]